MSIRSTATKRLATLKKGDAGMFASSAVSRIAPAGAPRSRETASADDSAQVRGRLSAERIPEADVRRGKRRGTY